MSKHNATNERIKRRYFAFLREAKRHSEDTVDSAAAAISRFEAYTGYKDFKAFHVEQAIAFKKHMGQSHVGRGPLSKATLHTTFSNLKRFFQWLAGQPGYRSQLTYSDAEYFNLSEKDTRIATARRPRAVPTMEQVLHVIARMPSTTDIERRDRAVVAFALLTGARDGAIASAKLKHVDLGANSFYQDAREVRTKFSKSFTTFFFPVGKDIAQIFASWINYLRSGRKWGNDAPVFPATRMVVGPTGQFETAGLAPKHWSNAEPIRRIFKTAFLLPAIAALLVMLAGHGRQGRAERIARGGACRVVYRGVCYGPDCRYVSLGAPQDLATLRADMPLGWALIDTALNFHEWRAR